MMDDSAPFVNPIPWFSSEWIPYDITTMPENATDPERLLRLMGQHPSEDVPERPQLPAYRWHDDVQWWLRLALHNYWPEIFIQFGKPVTNEQAQAIREVIYEYMASLTPYQTIPGAMKSHLRQMAEAFADPEDFEPNWDGEWWLFRSPVEVEAVHVLHDLEERLPNLSEFVNPEATRF